MNCEILSIGTELLLGNILDTNAQFLSAELAKLGIDCFHRATVGDNPKRLKEAFETAISRSDVIIATGGLGPTGDDITKAIADDVFGLASDLPNDFGTALGCHYTPNGKHVFLLPGPPWEAEPMYSRSVVPVLQKCSDTILFSRTLKIVGVGESNVEKIVKDLIDSQTNPTIAPYAKLGEASLRITAKAKETNEAKHLIQPIAEEIYKRLGENVYAEDDVSMAEVVAGLLESKNMTVACAESCTGGLLTSALVAHSGISRVLLESCVTYTNVSKMKRLSVCSETLEKYGAVSEETAREMAEGMRRASGASCAVATTGIAGPNGGSEEKPIGLVYVAISFDNGNTVAKELRLRGNRQLIRERAVMSAMDFLRRELLQHK
jgi:nicotinamide-nucleotide amidase